MSRITLTPRLPARLACLAILAVSTWLELACARGQSPTVSIAEALDDPGGVWTGSVAVSAVSRGWIGIADPAMARDGTDALRPVSFRLWWAPLPGVIILPPAPITIRRQLPGSGVVSFWWRRVGDNYGTSPAECRIADTPVASVPSGAWARVNVAVAGSVPLDFTDWSQDESVWIDEFSFSPATAPAIDEILDSPGLTIFAVGHGEAWLPSPDAAPGAPDNGCLRLPANIAGQMKLKTTGTGTLKYWTLLEWPGFGWTQTTVSIRTAPAVTTIARNFPLTPALNVDGITWIPSTPVSLAEALDTSLEITGSLWDGVRDELMSADRIDAAIARTNYGALTTTITGPARVRFRGANPGGPDFQTLNFSVDGRVADTTAGGYSRRDIFIRESGPHSLQWIGAAGAAVDLLTVEPLPEIISTSLNEALDTNDFTFSQEGSPGWEGRVEPKDSDRQAAAYSPFLASSAYPQSWETALTAQFSNTQTSRVSFDAKFDHSHGGDYQIELDGLRTRLPATSGAWSHRELIVGPGTHVIKWLAIQNGRLYANDPPPIAYRRLMLDRLALTPSGGISPDEALDFPGGIMLVDPGENVTVDTSVTHDGQDALRLTVPENGLSFPVRRGPAANEYYLHLWVRTDAAPGSVVINEVVIGSGEWIPVLIYNEQALVIQGPPGSHVWIDQMVPLASTYAAGEASEALDFAAVRFVEGYLYYYGAEAAHDGEDLVAGVQSSSDDRAILEFRCRVSGPASATFWWRAQRQSGYAGAEEFASARVAVDGRPAAILDARFAGPWRKASVQIPEGDHEVGILMNGSNHTTLFLDQFSIEPPNPLATWDGFMAASGLTGPAAAPGFDADGDGWANLAEFTLSTDPASSASRPAAALSLSQDSEGYLHLHLRGINPASIFYSTITLQGSIDLSPDSWGDLPRDLTGDSFPLRPADYSLEPGGSLTLSIPVEPLQRQFFRAMFSYQPLAGP